MKSWLEIESEQPSRRHELQPGLTRVGAAGCELEVAVAGADQLHVWDDPPRLLFVGKGEPPQINGAPTEMWPLSPGDRIEWRGVRLGFDRQPEPARLEELPAPDPGEPLAVDAVQARAWRRVHAGLAFELGLADRAAARRWQEAVKRGEFDPDACARELVQEPLDGVSEQRVLDRCGRLLRDLLMAPLLRGVRGAGRAVRGAARTGLAYVISQAVVTTVFFVLFAIVLLVVRLRWDWSVDELLDRVLERVPGVGGDGG